MFDKPVYPHPWQHPYYLFPGGWNPSWPVYANQPRLRDYGGQPFVINIDQAAKRNNTFRTALWTGEHFQVTLMSIAVGEDIGLEVHPNTDQFVRVEAGQGLVQMGNSRDQVDFEQMVYPGDAVMIPAGTWHDVINMGNTPLKVYVLYAPPEHSFGTVHPTKASAREDG